MLGIHLSNRLSRLIFAAIFILAGSASVHGQEYSYRQPESLEDGWKTRDIRSFEVDTTRIYQLFNQLAEGSHKLHSLLLIKDGSIVLEEYLNDYPQDKPHDLRSVTKSIRSVLMGIAIDKGFIDSIDDPIFKYLDLRPKKNLDKRKDSITIRHLLTMSSGLDCDDWDKNSKGQEDKVYKKKDWLQYTLDLPMVQDPGIESKYCSMGVILAAEIISRASKMSIDEFADQYLFEPLGITNMYWGHTSIKEVIASGKRAYMTSRDMAKIGQLVLNKGKWDDVQIVSKQWIEESTSEKVQITGINYGFYWWKIPFQVNDRMVYSNTATGNGGQYIMIIPDMNIVAVFTGGAYNSPEDKLPFAITKDIFLNIFLVTD